MFNYYNPSPDGKNVGDCVIRALSKALNKSWEDIYIDLCVYGLYMADMPSSNAVWGAYLVDNGFNMQAISKGLRGYTIGDFAADNPEGVYIMATGTHVVAIIDGDIYDSWNSEKEIPIYYFYKGGD